MSSGMPPFMIVGIIIAYLVVFAGVLMLLGQQPAGSVDHMLEGIKDKLPFIMTIAAIAGSLIFYSALDKVLAVTFLLKEKNQKFKAAFASLLSILRSLSSANSLRSNSTASGRSLRILRFTLTR